MAPTSTVSRSGIEGRKTFSGTWQNSIGAPHYGLDVAPHSIASSCKSLDTVCNPCFGHSLCCLTPCHILYVHIPQVPGRKHRVRLIALHAFPPWFPHAVPPPPHRVRSRSRGHCVSGEVTYLRVLAQ